MGNQRVFYACQGLAFNGKPLAGVQSISVNTENNLYPVEKFGSYDIPEIYSDIPRVRISVSRIIDNSLTYPVGEFEDIIADHSHKICLFTGSDTLENLSDSSGNYVAVFFKNLSIDSVSYNFNVDNFLTEDIEFIGFHKEISPSGDCNISVMEDLPSVEPSSQNVLARQDISSYDLGTSIPSGILNSVSISTTFNVNTVQEFGKARSNYEKTYRYPTLPIVTTISASILYQNDASFDDYEFIYPSSGICKEKNVKDKTSVSFNLCNDNSIECSGCILSNIDYAGGNTDGSNVIITYNYNCYNGFKVS